MSSKANPLWYDVAFKKEYFNDKLTSTISNEPSFSLSTIYTVLPNLLILHAHSYSPALYLVYSHRFWPRTFWFQIGVATENLQFCCDSNSDRLRILLHYKLVYAYPNHPSKVGDIGSQSVKKEKFNFDWPLRKNRFKKKECQIDASSSKQCPAWTFGILHPTSSKLL